VGYQETSWPTKKLKSKEATRINPGTPNTGPIDFSVAKSIIKRTKCDPPPEYPLIKETYSKQERKRYQIVKSRKDGATLAQLRSGTVTSWLHIALSP
jgi:hypothetical protein